MTKKRKSKFRVGDLVLDLNENGIFKVVGFDNSKYCPTIKVKSIQVKWSEDVDPDFDTILSSGQLEGEDVAIVEYQYELNEEHCVLLREVLVRKTFDRDLEILLNG